jgi:hypothetical protein
MSISRRDFNDFPSTALANTAAHSSQLDQSPTATKNPVFAN